MRFMKHPETRQSRLPICKRNSSSWISVRNVSLNVQVSCSPTTTPTPVLRMYRIKPVRRRPIGMMLRFRSWPSVAAAILGSS